MPLKMIRVDQAIHGYSRGHKELSSSIELDSHSRTTMLMMSDLLAVPDLLRDESYLTIYPLKSASRHIVARTWAAGSNYRPGSVWTHSLILDYQALTLINDLASLLAYFKMPTESTIESYGKPLEINPNLQSNIEVKSDDRIHSAIYKLYGPIPYQTIELPHRGIEEDEFLALAIWRQMWPALRRDFAALTNLGDGSVGFESACTIRFSRHTLPIVESSPLLIEDGLKELEDDLPEPGPTPLRNFLGRYAIEGKEPRRLAAALAASRIDETLSADLRLELVRTLSGGESLPRFVRDLVSQEFVRIRNSAELLQLVRTSRHELVEIDLAAPVAFARTMALNDLKDLVAATMPSASNELGGRLYIELLNNLDLDKLAHIAGDNDRIRMAGIRPTLLLDQHFWPSDDLARAKLIRQLPPDAFSLSEAIKVFGPSMGLKALTALFDVSLEILPEDLAWLIKVENPSLRNFVATWAVSNSSRIRLMSESSIDLGRRALEILAEALLDRGNYPDDAQSWASLILRTFSGEPATSRSLSIVGYLSSLTLSGAEAFEVARTVFDCLYSLVNSYALTRIEERYLQKKLTLHASSWSLRKMLLLSALAKWPVTPSHPGVFGITRNKSIQDEFIDEMISRSEITALSYIQHNLELPEHIREKIRDRLNPSKYKKTSIFYGDP